jgi:hypothetical protein
MRCAVGLAVLAWAMLSSVAAAAETPAGPPIPPLPPPVIPPMPIPARPAPTPPAIRAIPIPAGRPKPRRVPPTIHLREKLEGDDPHWHGAGTIEPAKIQVKAEKGTLRTILLGAVSSHSFFGRHSESLSKIRLIQEFDIESGSADDPMVVLLLAARLDGYIQSERNAGAALRLADAAVYPAGCAPVVGLAFAPVSVSGTEGKEYRQEYEAPSRVVPAGRYVLVANLVLETALDGHLRSHAEAVFAPGANSGSWRSKDKALGEIEEGDLGFAVTLEVEAPHSRR